MRRPNRVVWTGVLAACLAANAYAGVAPASCGSGAVPAATLLVPFFEVDFTSNDRKTTLFAVTNTGAEPTLAHVVIWTDWGVPTLNFDLYLAPDDVQSVNLRDVFAGVLPHTGGGLFTGCTNPLTLPVLDAIALEALRKQHTGQPDDLSLCSGSGRAGANVATGFVTIDVAQACSATITYPGDAGYFAEGGTGIAGNANVLVGDFFYVDTAENFAQGNEAVGLVADAARFGGLPATFYGTWVAHGGVDARAPLGTRYRSRYLNGGAFSGGTDLIVWAEPDVPTPQGVTCGSRPTFVNPCQFLRTTAFDEAANGQTPVAHFVVSEIAARLSVGTTAVPVVANFGFVDLENAIQQGCDSVPTGETPLQLWVMPLSSADGRFSVGLNAHRTGDALCPGPPV